MVHGLMGRFSDGGDPTELLVNARHVVFWQPIENDHVLIHFLHGSGIEITESLSEIQKLITTTPRDTL